jgi:hypothetical protein
MKRLSALVFIRGDSLHSRAKAALPLIWVVSAKQPYHFFRWTWTPYPLRAPEAQHPQNDLLEPIGKRGRELSIDQKPHAAAGDSTAWSAWSAA